MSQEVDKLKAKLAEEKRLFDEEIDQKVAALKAEAEVHREQRSRLRQTKLQSSPTSSS